ncbi:sortase [Candidatus Daviesbacteria bacterium]|nr:sortase [Candidatus Daviesbacteria bacterium]
MIDNFKFVLLIRFVGYLVFFTGLLTFLFILGPLVKAEAEYRMDRILGVRRTVPNIITSDSGQTGSMTSFSDLKVDNNTIIPVSTEFGIVIEKINANAKIVANVDPGNEKEYAQALTLGVAQAQGSTDPGQPGNLYLFSHSTDAPWNIIRFNAVFYLLRELNNGDRVIIFYKNKRYDYIVYDKTVVSPSDVTYLTNRYDVPVLTLQTCDPPGTLLNRLVIRAKLVNS